MSALVLHQFVLQLPLCLKLLFGAFGIESDHLVQVLNLQLFQSLLIHLVGHQPIDVPLLFLGYLLIVCSRYILYGLLVRILLLFLDCFVVCRFNGQPFLCREVSMFQFLLVELHFYLQHPLRIFEVVLFASGIFNAVCCFLACLPFLFLGKLVHSASISTRRLRCRSCASEICSAVHG